VEFLKNIWGFHKFFFFKCGDFFQKFPKSFLGHHLLGICFSKMANFPSPKKLVGATC
jgi:hypothetical protein